MSISEPFTALGISNHDICCAYFRWWINKFDESVSKFREALNDMPRDKLLAFTVCILILNNQSELTAIVWPEAKSLCWMGAPTVYAREQLLLPHFTSAAGVSNSSPCACWRWLDGYVADWLLSEVNLRRNTLAFILCPTCELAVCARPAFSHQTLFISEC